LCGEGLVAIKGGICCCVGRDLLYFRRMLHTPILALGEGMASPPMVYKSNALIEAAYRLSVQEQRILLACISQVRRDELVTDEVMYSVTAEEIATRAGVAIESSYTQLREAALRLKRREVRLTQEPNGKDQKPSIMITGWVQTIVYREGEGRVELRFAKDMLPYLTELTKQFTKYSLADVAKMDSTYAIRLYELLMQWDSIGQREIAIDQLRAWFQLEGRYPSIKDFKKWVLEPAVEQINEHSPLTVNWCQQKTGRRVTHLVFDFSQKSTAKPVVKSKKLPDARVAKLARPGETWEAARARLQSQSS